MVIKRFAKKFVYISAGYAVLYFFYVFKLYTSTGVWYWNLFSYFGTVPLILMSGVFYVFVFWITKYENY